MNTKKFKLSFFTIVLVLFTAGSIVTLNSCKKDPCKDETCNDHGTPTANDDVCDCECNAGYEGETCEDEIRTKFLGTYPFSESCTSGTDTYTVTVSSSSLTEISILNIYDQGFTTKATVSGTTLTIASQTFGLGTISGSGTISGNTLSITYTITLGSATDSCTGSGTK